MARIFKESRRREEHLPKRSNLPQKSVSAGSIQMNPKIIDAKEGRGVMVILKMVPLGQPHGSYSGSKLPLAGKRAGFLAVNADF